MTPEEMSDRDLRFARTLLAIVVSIGTGVLVIGTVTCNAGCTTSNADTVGVTARGRARTTSPSIDGSGNGLPYPEASFSLPCMRLRRPCPDASARPESSQ